MWTRLKHWLLRHEIAAWRRKVFIAEGREKAAFTELAKEQLRHFEQMRRIKAHVMGSEQSR